MTRVTSITVGTLLLSSMMLIGCQTNSRIPEIRDASFNRTAAPASTDATHEVRLGETLYSIAWRYNIDYHDLARWNNMASPYPLRVGHKLRLSAPTTTLSADAAQVKPLPGGDSLPSARANGAPTDGGGDSWLIGTPAAVNTAAVSAQPTSAASAATQGKAAGAPASNKGDTSASERQKIDTPAAEKQNKAEVPAATAPSAAAAPEAVAPSPATTSLWQWPTKGTVVSKFSDPSPITAGIDIAGQKGQPVVASRSGTVVYAGNSVRGYGNLVIIKHDDHFLTAYAYNEALKVKEHDSVKAGQIIATLGGFESDRSKLHFEIRQDGQSKDPQLFLPRS